mmetsp:Transcript_21241/g.47931  ORF Transcript_21241/g.47931 Transcript_21241/m.47931 type:complete len:317 (-) Transcript_21241:237-1187(-)
MALVNVTNVIVLDNPTSFSNDFQFEVENSELHPQSLVNNFKANYYLPKIILHNIQMRYSYFLASWFYQIEFECLGELEDDLEWKVTYVGSAEDQTRDQVLEEVMVGPVPQGVSKFVLTAPCPDRAQINEADLVGVTVCLVTCSYRDKEFVRIGYYVNNEFYHENPLNFDHAAAQQRAQLEALHRAQQQAQDPAAAQAAALPVAPVGPVAASEEEIAALVAQGPLDVSKVFRSIMSDRPRVTRFQIDWAPLALQQMRLQEQQQQQHSAMEGVEAAKLQGVQASVTGGLPAPPLMHATQAYPGYAPPQPPGAYGQGGF